jgi:uncharacterized SAM-binding protein YcdF (DUF218 family)
MYRIVTTKANQGNPRPADCIIVLGAAVLPGGQPSPALKGRVALGIQLYRQRYAPQLVLTGGIKTYPPPEAEIMQKMALAAGIPPETIIVENQARTTQQSAELVGTIARSRGWTNVLIVSDPFHLARAEELFRCEGLRVSLAGTDEHYYTPQKRLRLRLHEALGLLRYSIECLFKQPLQAIPD